MAGEDARAPWYAPATSNEFLDAEVARFDGTATVMLQRTRASLVGTPWVAVANPGSFPVPSNYGLPTVTLANPTSYGLPTVAIGTYAPATTPVVGTVQIGNPLATIAIGTQAATSYGLPTVTLTNPAPATVMLASVAATTAVISRELIAGSPTYYAGVGGTTVGASGRLVGIRVMPASGFDSYLRLSGGASIVTRDGAGLDWSPLATYNNATLEVGSSCDWLIEAQV